MLPQLQDTLTHQPMVALDGVPLSSLPSSTSGNDFAAQRQQHAAASTAAGQRKRTMTADELAAEEALRIGSISGKRQRRPAAKLK